VPQQSGQPDGRVCSFLPWGGTSAEQFFKGRYVNLPFREALNLLDRAVREAFLGPRRDRAKTLDEQASKEIQFAFLPAFLPAFLLTLLLTFLQTALVFAAENRVIENVIQDGHVPGFLFDFIRQTS
jgi:hypothetical protein